MSTPESRAKTKINKLLDSYDCIYYFMPVPSGYGKMSIDYLCCVDGLFVGIEAKRFDGRAKPTDRQVGVMEDIRKAGGSTFVVACEEDLDVLENFLYNIKRSKPHYER